MLPTCPPEPQNGPQWQHFAPTAPNGYILNAFAPKDSWSEQWRLAFEGPKLPPKMDGMPLIDSVTDAPINFSKVGHYNIMPVMGS